MTQQEFKEILESIEVGLYDKWKTNRRNYLGEFHLNEIEDKNDMKFLIFFSFIWSETPKKQGYTYWYDINEKYQTILAERGLI